MSFDHDGAAAKSFESRTIWLPFHQNEITPPMFEPGVEEAVFEGFLISEKEQSFGIHVEPANRETSFGEMKAGERLLPLLTRVGVELTQHAIGFVKGKEHELG